MEKLRIGITCYPSYGGSGVVATELGKQLAQRGHEVHFITYEVPFRLSRFEENIYFHGVEVPNYPLFNHPPYLIALANKMVEVTKYHSLDLLHVHYAIPHATAAYLARSVLQGRTRVITTLHGTDITLLGSDPSFAEIIAFSINQSDGVTTISDSLRRETLEEFPIETDVRTIYNFIDPVEYRRESDPSCCRCLRTHDRERLIVHISNFRPVKRIEDVVRVFAGIEKEMPARLLMVGDGPDSTLARQTAKCFGIQDKVSFLGKVDRVAPVLAASDLLLLPSEKESFGLVALEAMACGVPVVASNTGGLPEVVEEGVSGFLRPVGAVDAMVEAALTLLGEEATWSGFSTAARSRAVGHFSTDTIIPQYEAYYRQVLSGC